MTLALVSEFRSPSGLLPHRPTPGCSRWRLASAGVARCAHLSRRGKRLLLASDERRPPRIASVVRPYEAHDALLRRWAVLHDRARSALLRIDVTPARLLAFVGLLFLT